MIFTATLLNSFIKLLLVPAYKSTDFEVHRNWLAITHSLPIKRWYFENTSEWTLDYPPLFAYFEYCLSLIAPLFDANMLVVENLNYESEATVLFQRLTVIVTDLVYAYGAYRCCKSIQKSWRSDVVLPILLITNCGLLMVDHIHFQYNGIMYGILLLSVADMFKDNYLASAFWFTILLNMKHIYIYLAPAYFVFLLKHYCMRGQTVKNLSPETFRKIAVISSLVLVIFLLVFLPFYDHLGQVLARMFPFKRGLCHAYWAPNFWAVYNIFDKVLAVTLPKLGLIKKNNAIASMTGGLVQEFAHEILPSVKPLVTIILTGGMMLPVLIKLWNLNKNPVHFLQGLVICALTSFLFGWHVHEKAILMAIIPLTILAVINSTDAKIFLILSITGHYSLFPLLFPNSLLIIKVLLLIVYSTYAFHSLSKVHPTCLTYSLPLLSGFESLYIIGLVPLFLYENFVHNLLGLGQKLPFLPLMLTSFYCALGVILAWGMLYVNFLRKPIEQKSRKKLQ